MIDSSKLADNGGSVVSVKPASPVVVGQGNDGAAFLKNFSHLGSMRGNEEEKEDSKKKIAPCSNSSAIFSRGLAELPVFSMALQGKELEDGGVGAIDIRIVLSDIITAEREKLDRLARPGGATGADLYTLTNNFHQLQAAIDLVIAFGNKLQEHVDRSFSLVQKADLECAKTEMRVLIKRAAKNLAIDEKHDMGSVKKFLIEARAVCTEEQKKYMSYYNDKGVTPGLFLLQYLVDPTSCLGEELSKNKTVFNNLFRWCCDIEMISEAWQEENLLTPYRRLALTSDLFETGFSLKGITNQPFYEMIDYGSAQYVRNIALASVFKLLMDIAHRIKQTSFNIVERGCAPESLLTAVTKVLFSLLNKFCITGGSLGGWRWSSDFNAQELWKMMGIIKNKVCSWMSDFYSGADSVTFGLERLQSLAKTLTQAKKSGGLCTFTTVFFAVRALLDAKRNVAKSDKKKTKATEEKTKVTDEKGMEAGGFADNCAEDTAANAMIDDFVQVSLFCMSMTVWDLVRLLVIAKKEKGVSGSDNEFTKRLKADGDSATWLMIGRFVVKEMDQGLMEKFAAIEQTLAKAEAMQTALGKALSSFFAPLVPIEQQENKLSLLLGDNQGKAIQYFDFAELISANDAVPTRLGLPDELKGKLIAMKENYPNMCLTIKRLLEVREQIAKKKKDAETQASKRKSFFAESMPDESASLPQSEGGNSEEEVNIWKQRIDSRDREEVLIDRSMVFCTPQNH